MQRDWRRHPSDLWDLDRRGDRPLASRICPWLVLVALSIALSSIVAMAHGTTPGWIDTRAPSQAVYRPHSLNVIYDHTQHSERMPCMGCHRVRRDLAEADQTLMPTMETCGDCHPQVADTENPDACGHCHAGYRPVWPTGEGMMSTRDPRFPVVGPTPPIRLISNLIFSHGVHLGRPCQVCHPVEVRGGASLPLEEICLDCHRQEGAPTECAACHPTGTDGRLVTRLEGDGHVAAQVLRPRDHGGDWYRGHSASVGAEPTTCFACHSERDCLSCHNGLVGVRSIHQPGYMEHHGLDARRSTERCASCHDISSYCINCHIDAGFGGDGAHGPPQGYSYHSQGWYDIDGAHGPAAQHNILECASCHEESHCSRCHMVIRPHGPDFLARCSALRSANPGVCLRCHDREDWDLIGIRCP